jgi:hypothetical protein
MGPFATSAENRSGKRRRLFGRLTGGFYGRSLISDLACFRSSSFVFVFIPYYGKTGRRLQEK